MMLEGNSRSGVFSIEMINNNKHNNITKHRGKVLSTLKHDDVYLEN